MARIARDECTAEEELFCQLVVFKHVPEREAAIQAGWALSTIQSRGVKFLSDRPRIKQRMAELRQEVLAKHGKSLEDVFLAVRDHVGDAINVLAELMHTAESEAVRQRSATAIAEIGKGLVIAAMPRKMTFEVLMSQLSAQGKQRALSNEPIDITPKAGGSIEIKENEPEGDSS